MVWTTASWGLPFWWRAVKLRTSAVDAFGSAYARRWHGKVIPCLGSVPVIRQVRPGTARASWALDTSDAGEICTSSAGGSSPVPLAGTESSRSPAAARVGWTPWASATRKPLPTIVATTRPAPATAWVRRRVVPARRMIVARGQRWSRQWSASCSSRCRTCSRRHLALQCELGRGTLQPLLGVVERQPDLARHLLPRRAGELGEEQRLARHDRQLREGVEGRPDLRVELAVAVPDPRRVPALGVAPDVRPDPGLGVVEPLDLGPVVPRGDERVADGTPGRRQVAGERERQHQQPFAALGVVGVELLGIGHGADHGTRRPSAPPIGRDAPGPPTATPPAWHARTAGVAGR